MADTEVEVADMNKSCQFLEKADVQDSTEAHENRPQAPGP